MAPHSSTLAWKLPWTEEPGGLQSMESLRVRHDWVTSLSCTGEGNGNPLQCTCLENPRDGGASWAAIYGVAQSRTWLKRLSSSSSLSLCLFLSSENDHRNFLVKLGKRWNHVQSICLFSSFLFSLYSESTFHLPTFSIATHQERTWPIDWQHSAFLVHLALVEITWEREWKIWLMHWNYL